MERKKLFFELMDEVLIHNFNTTTSEGAFAQIAILLKEKKLHSFVVERSENMVDNDFNIYYGDIINQSKLLNELSESLNDTILCNFLLDYSQEGYRKILKNRVNRDNFIKLWESEYFSVFQEFNTDFRGTIQKIHEFDGIVIVETLDNVDKNEYYVIGENNRISSYTFSELSSAYVYAKNPEHHKSIMVLLRDK